jgi:hypothetical protein
MVSVAGMEETDIRDAYDEGKGNTTRTIYTAMLRTALKIPKLKGLCGSLRDAEHIFAARTAY